MEEQIRTEIVRFIRESPLNRFPDRDEPYFDEPLVGFAAADDQLFADYKSIIGDFHRTPQEVMESALNTGGRAVSVICWILPITQLTRESNRREEQYPSRAWAQTRFFGEQFNAALRRHLVAWLEERGQQAVACCRLERVPRHAGRHRLNLVGASRSLCRRSWHLQPE